jgi:hypothetical protein
MSIYHGKASLNVLSKQQRVKAVSWIRKGAPLQEGIRLYASLPYKPRLMAALENNPGRYQEHLNLEICGLLGISIERFQQIIQEYAQKQPPGSRDKESDKASSIAKADPPKRSFRSEFPFLSRSDCPTELKALAADKITAWERYTAAHEKLFDCSSLEECYQTAFEVVENYLENRAIYEELQYYASHGSVLGKHPIFEQLRKFSELRGKSVIELVKLHEKTLPHRIWRIESEISKGDKPHLQGERTRRLHTVQAELAEVRRILGIL